MAFIRVIALALVLAASSHPSESARDQYDASGDTLQPQRLPKATDHSPQVHNLINKNAKQSAIKPLRKKRSYTPWSRQIEYTPYQSINVWKPPVYQLSRPYYIPIYGVPGRIPIYFPPQPLYINTGGMKDNPTEEPFQGPTYLPPTTLKPSTSTMNIEDRFNGGDNNDDRPVWDGVDQQTPRPKPTRVPEPPGGFKVPPLVHNPTDPEGFNSIGESGGTTTAAPASSERPRPSEPSRCVWAIISCCTSTNTVSTQCFEQRGCAGPFWDNNPCDSDFARAAIEAALNYYNK